MKKLKIVSFLSFGFLLLASVVTFGLKNTYFVNPWLPLIIGGVILLFSGLAAIIGKKSTVINLICYAVSGVALGFCIRAWYMYRGFDNPFWVLVLVSLVCVSYLWVAFALSRLPFAQAHPALFVILLLVVSLAAYICLVIFTKTTYVSTFGYYMIVEIAFLFAMFTECESTKELIRHVTLSTYSVAVVILLIALMLLAGDGADFDLDLSLDGLDFGGGKKDKKGNTGDISM